MEGQHAFLFDEHVDRPYTGQVLKVKLLDRMFPSEAPAPCQLEVLPEHACPKLFHRIHVKCEFTDFF